MLYEKSHLESLVRSSLSFTEVCKKLDVKEGTGSHNRLIHQIKNFGIDTSHFIGRGWNKGRKLGYKRPLEDYLTNKMKISSWKLKNRLFDEKILEKICSSCQLTTWLGKEMPLELDHINGNRFDNSLNNLRILCPNCHTQTPTYKTKNRKLK